MPVLAVGKAGRADFGAAEGEGVEARVGFGRVEAKGPLAKGSLAGMPTYSVRPAFFAAGGDVGVDAAVGRVAGARDAAVVDAVEDAGGASAEPAG